MSLFRFASALSRPARTTFGPFVHPQLRRSFADEALLKTALFDLHVELGGKMVPFAGYALPVQYKDGVVDSHLWVRNHAGLFDVSHMGQLRLTGTEAGKFVEHVTVVDLNNLKPNQASLSLITNSKGGIIDDTIVTKGDNYIGMVVNGACKHKDMLHMKSIMSSFKDVQMHYFEDRSLLALQGPTAAEVLKSLIASDINVDAWPFMFQRDITVAGIPCGVTRCGYTGEDGFEISVASTKAVELAKKLLEHKEVKPTGLAVRDSLRLEAGLCLYGHDLNENINPVEGTLMWTISERRRKEGGFLGHSDIMAAIKTVQKKRVGLIVQGAPAREHAPIQNSEGKEIGVITSGSFSPVLKKAISMGYVPTAQAAVGSQVNVVVRGKSSPAVVTKMPFVPNRYHRVK